MLAATFSQHCHSSVCDINLKATNLEYVGWVEGILAVDYGRYEMVALYCNWVVANMVGQNATMKRGDNGFSLVKFAQGVHFLLYFAYTCVRNLFIGGVINLAKNIIR